MHRYTCTTNWVAGRRRQTPCSHPYLDSTGHTSLCCAMQGGSFKVALLALAPVRQRDCTIKTVAPSTASARRKKERPHQQRDEGASIRPFHPEQQQAGQACQRARLRERAERPTAAAGEPHACPAPSQPHHLGMRKARGCVALYSSRFFWPCLQFRGYWVLRIARNFAVRLLLAEWRRQR